MASCWSDPERVKDEVEQTTELLNFIDIHGIDFTLKYRYLGTNKSLKAIKLNLNIIKEWYIPVKLQHLRAKLFKLSDRLHGRI
jgi:hypothetical protein